jgi:glycosyltransferase involved in cell wall biosynthesis
LLFAGKLIPFKRPLDLIIAASKCRNRAVRVEVMIAGSGALEPDLAGAAEGLSVPLYLLGFRNQTEMPAAYAAADCLVLPSDGRESWGLVANEALACGRPIVVSSSCGCAPDLVSNGDVGRAFPVGDVEALADAICGLIASPPPPSAIAARSAAYSIQAAVAGIRSAAERVVGSA